MIKVVIADDQILLAESLKIMLEQEVEITVEACVHNGQDVLEHLSASSADVVLLDIRMPVLDGLTTLKEIKKRFINTKVVILTTFENSEDIISSFLGGASGYIVKDVQPEELIACVKAVHMGFYVNHETAHQALLELVGRRYVQHEQQEKYNLSETEQRLIMLICEGKSNSEIASEIGYSEGTVRNKISVLLQKLNLKDRVQLAAFGFKQ